MNEFEETTLTLQAAYQRVQLFKEHTRMQTVLSSMDLRSNETYLSESQELLNYTTLMAQALTLMSSEVVFTLQSIRKDIEMNTKISSSLRTKAIHGNLTNVMNLITNTLYNLK